MATRTAEEMDGIRVQNTTDYVDSLIPQPAKRKAGRPPKAKSTQPKRDSAQEEVSNVEAASVLMIDSLSDKRVFHDAMLVFMRNLEVKTHDKFNQCQALATAYLSLMNSKFK